MANIGFFVLPNIGGVNACFKLASDLRERGHQISFFGIEDCKEAIQANGFEFVCVFQEFFKKGDYHEQVMVGSLPIGLELFRAIKHLNARFQVFFDGLLSSGADDFIETLRNKRPDLIIFASGDIYLEWPAMLAYMKGFNSIYFNDGSYTCEEEGMPPHSSTYIPTDAMKSRLIIFLLWKWGDFKQTLALLTCKLLGIDPGFHEFTTKLARQCGYDLNIHHIPSESAVPRVPEFMPSIGGKKVPRLVELVPCPPGFRFPGARDIPGRYYIEPTIYLDIDEPDFPWNKLRESQPLIYCTMGTAVWLDKDKYKNFYGTIVDAASRMPEWDFVIATGRSLDVQELKEMPANVIAVNYAPQVKLLQRSSIVLFHGGTNTVKQCIYFGVPMIVFPVGCDSWGDASGIAARIVYHGLGVLGEWKRLSASYVEHLVISVQSSAFIRNQMIIKQQEFMELEELRPGLKMVEAILEGQSSAGQHL